MVKHFHWFTSHPGISKEALGSMLAMEHDLLPPGNNLPKSYNDALKFIEPYLVQPVVYDVCKNDCVIFRDEFSGISACPLCHSSRYVSEQSKTHARRFSYLPLKPRITRMFGTANLAGVLQSHIRLDDQLGINGNRTL